MDTAFEQPARPQIYQNRELSWLSFNERVLQESCRRQTPPIERLKFVAIYANNLDEFFMIRVGTLYDQSLLKFPERDLLGQTPEEQLACIFSRVRALVPRKDGAYESVTALLEESGLCRVLPSALTPDEYAALEERFVRTILPLLSPQIIDGRHPFPFLRNKELYIAVTLTPAAGKDKGKDKDKDKDKDKQIYGVIPASVPTDRLIVLPGSGLRYMLLEDVILSFAQRVFKKYRVGERAIVRITRNADIEVDDAPFDLDISFRDTMAELIRNRRVLAPVRLQMQGGAPSVERFFTKKLRLSRSQVFYEASPLDLNYIFELTDRARQLDGMRQLCYEPVTETNVSDWLSDGISRHLARHDLLLAYPYNSFLPMIELLNEAADDPEVVSIKISLYRLAAHSRIISALIKAAENGKDVMAVVELRARFDEENNITWSKRLEAAGVRVIYGSPGLKVHSKLLLVTYKRGQNIEYLTQVGTGNYNEQTARLYTDFSLFTTDRDIGSEASVVFNNFAVGELTDGTQHLLVAPKCLKTRVIELTDREIACARRGEEASIMIKCNSVSDRDIIDKFAEASAAGVKVTLFVRGICCFIAGVPGATENITVKSIVGRLLEHSRAYVFGVGERRKIYISSADFMTRNTENRVEVACPVYDKELQQTVMDLLDCFDRDTIYARRMLPDGSYTDVTDGEPFDSQRALFDYFAADAKKYSLELSRVKTKEAQRRRWLSGLFKK